MEQAAEAIALNLISTGLAKVTSAGAQKHREILQNSQYSEEIAEEFDHSLQSAIENVSANSGTGELTGVAESWDDVAQELYEKHEKAPTGETLIFDSNEDAVEKIAHAIAAANNYNLNKTPQLEQGLKQAVATAYDEAIASFAERISETDAADPLRTELGIQTLSELDRLQDQISALTQRLRLPRYYDLLDDSAEARRQVSSLVTPRDIEFVSRPELEPVYDFDRLLLLGPGGSGKSRALAELVENYKRDVDHILYLRDAFKHQDHIGPLRQETFEGDLLLVWDDVHATSPETENSVFRNTLRELEAILTDENSLHVLAAARTDELESIPGDPRKATDPLWSAFSIIDLESLDEQLLTKLFNRALDEFDVTASEDVAAEFIRRAIQTDPSPLYVVSVVQTTEAGQLTRSDIEELPPDSLAIWEDQYRDIKRANSEHRFILWAAKLLAELRVPYYRSVLKGIFIHIFDRSEFLFDPPLEQLAEQQWLVPTANDEPTLTRYVVHDIKIEAIDESIEDQLPALSSFFLSGLNQSLPPGKEDVRRILHGSLADVLSNQPDQQNVKLASEHYERILNDINPGDPMAHHDYGNLLARRLDNLEGAVNQYKQAIETNRGLPHPHLNYGLLLENELDDPERAADQYVRALELAPESAIVHHNYAHILADKLDDHQGAVNHYEQALEFDPEFSEKYNNYANLLRNKSLSLKEAADHYEQAIEIDPEYAEAHSNYALLLSNKLDDTSQATDHYEQALSLDPELTEAHENYANLLQDQIGDLCKAANHYERAIEIDPEYTEAYHKYGVLLWKENNPRKAADYFEQALRLNPKHADAHYNYATLLKDVFDNPQKAATHYQNALNIDPRDAEAHYNYASLLTSKGAQSDARSHLNTSIKIWIEDDVVTNALNDLHLLVQVCENMDDTSTAIKRCKQAYALIDEADTDEAESYRQQFLALYDQLT